MAIEIIFDTETTGLDPSKGHRVIEIGALKLEDRSEIIDEFHTYINPKRDVPKDSFDVHGISQEFLQDKQTFDAIAQGFLDFIGNFPLVAHNAAFDIRFLNFELATLGYNEISGGRVIDTLEIARKTFPGSPASLDALCKRFGIDLEERKRYGHGALLDAKLLAYVYRNLRRKNNVMLFEHSAKSGGGASAFGLGTSKVEASKFEFPYRNFKPDSADYEAHKKMIDKLRKK